MPPDQIFPTHHAVLRYRDRWRPGLDPAAARADLDRQLADATFLEYDGDFVYRLPCGALAIVKPDGAVATILNEGATRGSRRPVLARVGRRGRRPEK